MRRTLSYPMAISLALLAAVAAHAENRKSSSPPPARSAAPAPRPTGGVGPAPGMVRPNMGGAMPGGGAMQGGAGMQRPATPSSGGYGGTPRYGAAGEPRSPVGRSVIGQSNVGQSNVGRGGMMPRPGVPGYYGAPGQQRFTAGASGPGFYGAAARGRPGGAVFFARAPGQVARSSNRQFIYNGRSYAAVRAPIYRYPPGFVHQRFIRGQYLPLAFFVADYFIVDYALIGLDAPPPGDDWVRVDSDAVLVDQHTLQVQNTAPGVFDQVMKGPDDGDGGAPNTAQYASIDPTLPPEFAGGDVVLGDGSGGGCSAFYGDQSTRNAIDAVWTAQDWNAVAHKVITLGCDSDLSYYLLAISAESMGLHDGAVKYYNAALRLSKEVTRDPYKRCQVFGDACRGVAIAEESSQALQRLDQSGQ